MVPISAHSYNSPVNCRLHLPVAANRNCAFLVHMLREPLHRSALPSLSMGSMHASAGIAHARFLSADKLSKVPKRAISGQSQHIRASYPADSFKTLQPSFSYAATVTKTFDDGRILTAEIDHAIEVKTVSARIRTAAQSTLKQTLFNSTALGVISCAAAFGGMLLAPVEMLAIPAAAGVWGVYSFCKGGRSAAELSKWSSPVDLVRTKRRDLASNFSEIRSQNLKGVAFTDEEVADIWDESVRKSYKKMQHLMDQGQLHEIDNWIRSQFENLHLFSALSIDYGFPKDAKWIVNKQKSFVLLRADLEAISNDFTQMKQRYAMYKLYVKNRLQQIGEHEQAAMNAIAVLGTSTHEALEAGKNRALKPYKDKFNAALEDLERTRLLRKMADEAYRHHKKEITDWYDHHPEVRRILTEYQKNFEAVKGNAGAAQDLLHSKVNRQRKKVKDKAAEERVKVFEDPLIALYQRYLTSCKAAPHGANGGLADQPSAM